MKCDSHYVLLQFETSGTYWSPYIKNPLFVRRGDMCSTQQKKKKNHLKAFATTTLRKATHGKREVKLNVIEVGASS